MAQQRLEMPVWTADASLLRALTRTFIFREKTEQAILSLLTAAGPDHGPPVFTFDKGDVLCAPGSFRRALGILLRGEADVRRRQGGHQVLLNHLKTADSFGAAALFGDDAEYVTEIRATTGAAVLFIEGAVLLDLMRQDFDVAERYIRFLSDRIRFLNRRISGFTGGPADRKLALYLLEHCESDGTVVLPPGMKTLAAALDIGRSSLYRSLDALAGAGLIVRDNNGICIPDIARLRETLG